MLVLSRMVNEEVHLTISAEDLRKLAEEGAALKIRVAPVRIDRGRVRLGFVAPEAVKIARPEIYTPRQREHVAT